MVDRVWGDANNGVSLMADTMPSRPFAVRGTEILATDTRHQYRQTLDRRRTRAAGFHQHLVKPIQIDLVRAVIDALTGEKPRHSGH